MSLATKVNFHPSLSSFLEGSALGKQLGKSLDAGDVVIVPAGEGSNRVEAHEDMQGYLRGRTLGEAVHSAPEKSVEIARRPAPRHRPG